MRMNFIHVILGFTFAFILSLLLVGIMRKLALHLDILDLPDGSRKLQISPVPYLGGMGLIIAFLICISLGIYFISPSLSILAESANLLAPCLIMALVGLWDDLKNLSPQFRLMIQIILGLVCSISITFGSTSGNITNSESLNILLTIIWVVGITNAVNFFDNYDGGAAIATTITAIGMATYSALTGQEYIMAVNVVLIGVLLGFFYWNRKPARVYMGDAGALFVGMLLASLAVRIDPVAPSKFVSLCVPLLFLALPILDTCTVLICRLRNGRSPLQGGLDHISHRLANMGMNANKILLVIAIIGLQFQMIAVATYFASNLICKMLMALFAAEMILLLQKLLKVRVEYES